MHIAGIEVVLVAPDPTDIHFSFFPVTGEVNAKIGIPMHKLLKKNGIMFPNKSAINRIGKEEYLSRSVTGSSSPWVAVEHWDAAIAGGSNSGLASSMVGAIIARYPPSSQCLNCTSLSYAVAFIFPPFH